MSGRFNCNNIIEYDHVDSTNEVAENLIKKDHPTEGTVVAANFQYQGKGTGKNIWVSNPGENLLVSIILYPAAIDPGNQFVLNKMVSLSVLETVRFFTNDENITIKWPNDIYAGFKKISGILIKNVISGTTIKSSVVGIGLNVNQVRFGYNLPNPVSLKMLTGKTFHPKEVLHHLCSRLKYYYNMMTRNEYQILDQLYIENLLNFGKKAKYKSEGKYFWGEICGVSDIGRLQVKDNHLVREFDMKEIEYLFD